MKPSDSSDQRRWVCQHYYKCYSKFLKKTDGNRILVEKGTYVASTNKYE